MVALKTASAISNGNSPMAGSTYGKMKGPTAKMMSELGLPVTAVAVARRYARLLDGYVLDHADAGDAGGLDIPVAAAKTLMVTLEEREALARAVLAHADALAEAAA